MHAHHQSPEPWSGRTNSILGRSRFVLGLLTVLSLVLTTPYMLVTSGDDRPGIAASVLLLLALILACYRRNRVALTAEALEATCICIIMSAIPTPLTAFIFMFPLLWCRSLYGGSTQMLLRSALHMAAMVLSIPLSAVLVQPVEPDLATFLAVGLSSILFITIAGRQLAVGMQAHDAGARRERLMSASGTRLLGVTDQGLIRQISRQTLIGMAETVPGLRIIALNREGDQMMLTHLAGSHTGLQQTRRASDLGLWPDNEVAASAMPHPQPVLDETVGQRCIWVVLSFPWLGTDIFLALGHPRRVEPEIIAAVQSIANQAALALMNSGVHRDLTVQALTDGLTGLANRQGFTEATARLMATTADTPTAILFIDLDDFKNVNDVLGHKAGDDLLRQVADMLNSVVRADDVVSRLGGDEFAILLKNTSQSTAEQIAERIVLGISVLSIANGSDLSVGASIGVAMVDREIRLEDLLVHADIAMYSAKAHGKGQIQVYRPDLLPRAGQLVWTEEGAEHGSPQLP